MFDSPNPGFDIPVPALFGSGTATRVGDSNRFDFALDGGDTEKMVLCGLAEFSDPAAVSTPIVTYAVSFSSRGLALGSTRPGDRAAGLDAAELVDLWFGESDFAFDAAGQIVGSVMPSTVVEVTPAPE